MNVKTFDLTKEQAGWSDRSPLIEVVGRKLCRSTTLVTQLIDWEIQAGTLSVRVEKTDGRLGDLFDNEYHLIDQTINAEQLAEQLLIFFDELRAFGLKNGCGLMPSEDIKYTRDGNAFSFKFDDFQNCFSFDSFDPVSWVTYEWEVFSFMPDQWCDANEHRFVSPHACRIIGLHLAPTNEELFSTTSVSQMIKENTLGEEKYTCRAIDHKCTVELSQYLTKIDATSVALMYYPEASRIYRLYSKPDDALHNRLLMFYLGSFYSTFKNSGHPENVEEVAQLMEIVKKLPVPFWIEI